MEARMLKKSENEPWRNDPLYAGMSDGADLESSPLPNGPDDREPRKRTMPQPLALTFFDECGEFAQKQWILKGLLARGETSAWIAPPGAGKSALLTEIAIHCAAQRNWRGHKAKAACGVVIF